MLIISVSLFIVAKVELTDYPPLINISKDEIDDFVKIEFKSFTEMMLSIYSNNLTAGFEVRKFEILNNFKNSQYFVAKIGKKTVGTIEMIGLEAIKKYKTCFKIYYEKLGFFKAIKAYFFSSIEPYKMDGKTIYLDTVAVSKKYRGRGLAGKILSLSEDLAIKKGMEFLSLWVAEDNKIAYTVYEKSGFEPVIKKSSIIGALIFKHKNWIYMKKKMAQYAP